MAKTATAKDTTTSVLDAVAVMNAQDETIVPRLDSGALLEDVEEASSSLDPAGDWVVVVVLGYGMMTTSLSSTYN